MIFINAKTKNSVFFNYFHIHLFVIFVFFVILLFLFYFIILFFLLFLLCKMPKIAGHNISPFFEDFGPQSLKKKKYEKRK